MMQRITATALLAEGEWTRIRNPSLCQDATASLRVVETLGAVMQEEENGLLIKGGMHPTAHKLFCGESGLCLRMFSAIAALWHEEIVLSAEGSLCNRPVDMVEKPLRELGAFCKTHYGFPPIRVKGPLKGGKIVVDASVSSQFLTGLLLALPMIDNDTILKVGNLKSRPYLAMTLKLLKDLGIDVRTEDYEVFAIRGNQRYIIGEYTVEGDWSGASFLLVAAALTGGVTVYGLDPDSLQADRKVLDVLSKVGARVEIREGAVEVETKKLNAFRYDATDSPDLFPPLVALACHCAGTSIIKGVERMVHKESNRASVLEKELSKLGIRIVRRKDSLEIKGGPVLGGEINAHNDHRIAMAAAVAALKAEGCVTITDAQCVTKSYPRFFEDLALLGGDINE